MARPNLTDQSPMPFGKYKGQAMDTVPAKYLLWLWDNGVWEQTDLPVHNYIKESFSALETDAPDYIVTHNPK